MGIGDKAKNKAEELAGKAKAAVGDATDNKDLRGRRPHGGIQGRCEAGRGENLKDTGDDVADALRSAKAGPRSLRIPTLGASRPDHTRT